MLSGNQVKHLVKGILYCFPYVSLVNHILYVVLSMVVVLADILTPNLQ